MIYTGLYENWRDIVVYPDKGVQPQILAENDTYRCIIGGLSTGNKIPPQTEGAAIFHFLEGSGQMLSTTKLSRCKQERL